MTQYLNYYLNQKKIKESIQIGSLWVNTRLYTDYIFEVNTIDSENKLILIRYLKNFRLPAMYTYEQFSKLIQKYLFVPYSR